jgi:hypothetical protein
MTAIDAIVMVRRRRTNLEKKKLPGPGPPEKGGGFLKKISFC